MTGSFPVVINYNDEPVGVRRTTNNAQNSRRSGTLPIAGVKVTREVSPPGELFSVRY